MAAALQVVITPEHLAEMIRRELEPLRVELERIRGERSPTLVPIPEAAKRLSRDVRTVQRWAKTGRLEVEMVGGVRMVRLPPGVGAR